MQYVLTADWEEGVADLTQRIVHELSAGKQVLWLISGGSNIPMSVEIMNNITAELSQRLTVMPVDERYGPEGHNDSNLANLMRGGFAPKRAHMVAVLVGDRTFAETIAHYQLTVQQTISAADCIIGQFGIGADGHIAGILPESKATQASKELATGYRSDPYERLTMTFPALRKTTVAYAFAFGQSKAQALKALKSTALPLSTQPAQILKQLSEAYVYNDQLGDAE